MSRAAPMTPAVGPNSPSTMGRLPVAERKGLAVDLGADRGEQGVAEAGHAAADHHQAGVEEADETGDDLAGAVAALADQVERGGVARGGRRRDVDGAQVPRRFQPRREFAGSGPCWAASWRRGRGRRR
jgi:plasmid stabilization system protein ParE